MLYHLSINHDNYKQQIPFGILIARKNYCYMIVTGLFFSLLGDICVQIPHDGHESYLYKFGLGFFALSNVFYIWAFNSRYGSTFYFKFLLFYPMIFQYIFTIYFFICYPK